MRKNGTEKKKENSRRPTKRSLFIIFTESGFSALHLSINLWQAIGQIASRISLQS